MLVSAAITIASEISGYSSRISDFFAIPARRAPTTTPSQQAPATMMPPFLLTTQCSAITSAHAMPIAPQTPKRILSPATTV